MALPRERADALLEQDLYLSYPPESGLPTVCYILLSELLQRGSRHRCLVAGSAVQPVQASLTAVGKVLCNPVGIGTLAHCIRLATLWPTYTWMPTSVSRAAQ